MVNKIINNFNKSLEIKNKILSDRDTLQTIELISNELIECYRNGNKVFFCGNGGSFADAQHLAAELNGRFYYDRKPLEVVLLASNVSYLTAVANDYSYEEIFKREIQSSAKEGDVLICISTSGKSKNIIKCLNSIKDIKIKTISFTGNSGGDMKNISDISLIIPSNDTARIQEMYMIIGHSIIEYVEEILFPKK